MTKLVQNDIASLTNEQSALAALNSNYASLEAFSDTVLSRDGTTPNQMSADLDMNSNNILNLPEPVGPTEPLRLQDLSSFLGTGTITTGIAKPVPAVSTDNAIVRWDGVVASQVQNSTVTVADNGNIGLSTGAALSWNSGNLTITQAAGTLTIDGSSKASVSINPGQVLSVAPTGNSPTTLSSLSLQGTAVSNTTREFLVNIGLDVSTGSGATPPGKDKVGLYIGAIAHGASAGDTWPLNPLLEISADAGAINAHIIEADLNVFNRHYGETDSDFSPSVFGISISGAGNKRSTSAFCVNGPAGAGNEIWNRGILFAGSVKRSTLQDFTSSTISLDIQGSHTYGLDFNSGSFSGSPIRMGFGTGISWRNQANSGDISILTLSASTTELAALNLYNSSNANNVTKTAALNFHGLDTINTDKLTAQIIATPIDSNWVASALVIKARAADVVAETARFTSAALNLATGKVLQVNGTQVVSSRVTGWNAPTGTQTRGTFDAAATLATTAQTLVALIADLRTHGLIGT